MRYILFIFLVGCTSTVAQDGKELQKEREFEELVKKTSNNIQFSLQTQQEASKKQEQIVTQAVSTITTLKTEVVTLKTELVDVKEKLDSVSTDTGSNFILLPIVPKN